MVMVNLPTAGGRLPRAVRGPKGSSYARTKQGAYAAEFYTNGEDHLPLP